jgi:hypothetical protein
MVVTDSGLKSPVTTEVMYTYPLVAPVRVALVFRCDSVQFTEFVLVVLAILRVDLKIAAPGTLPSTNIGKT